MPGPALAPQGSCVLNEEASQPVVFPPTGLWAFALDQSRQGCAPRPGVRAPDSGKMPMEASRMRVEAPPTPF